MSAEKPSLDGAMLAYVDLRGVTVKSQSTTEKENAIALASVLKDAEQLHEVRVDSAVEGELKKLNRTITYDPASIDLNNRSPASWFSTIMESRYCENRDLPKRTTPRSLV